MSIWVTFKKYGAEESDDPDAWESEQAIAFLYAPAVLMQRYDVNASFIRSYRRHVNTRPTPTTFKGWLVRLFPRLFPVESFCDHNMGDWDGSEPFEPEELLRWATRWRQVLEYSSEEELTELMHWPPDDKLIAYLKEASENYQEFARKAMRLGWRIRMSVG